MIPQLPLCPASPSGICWPKLFSALASNFVLSAVTARVSSARKLPGRHSSAEGVVKACDVTERGLTGGGVGRVLSGPPAVNVAAYGSPVASISRERRRDRRTAPRAFSGARLDAAQSWPRGRGGVGRRQLSGHAVGQALPASCIALAGEGCPIRSRGPPDAVIMSALLPGGKGTGPRRK
ncbi:hypothetical protein MTO96_017137 [Rhipicephalus appendiculatus]